MGQLFDRQTLQSAWNQMLESLGRHECDLQAVSILDILFGYRMLCGRWPGSEETALWLSRPPDTGLDGLIRALAGTPEGRSRALSIEFERPAHDCLVMTETPKGLPFFFSLRDTFVGMPIAVGVFEKDVDGALARIVRPGMNCIDAGANLGFYTVQMAAAASLGGGRVFSFEPDQFAFSLLCRNVNENHLQNSVELFHTACGARNETAVLQSDPNPSNYGGMHIGGVAAAGSASAQEVLVKRVDDVISSDIRIGLIKVDVEGYELYTLLGMRRILRDHRPVILIEFNTPALRVQSPDCPARLYSFLSELDYSLYEAAHFAAGVAKEFQFINDESDVFVNLVCMPGGRTPEEFL